MTHLLNDFCPSKSRVANKDSPQNATSGYLDRVATGAFATFERLSSEPSRFVGKPRKGLEICEKNMKSV